MNEKELIIKATEGDWRSFEEIVRNYQDKVFSIALMLTKDGIEAEELAHLSFIKLWRNLGKFNFKSSFSTWLYRLVHNTFYDYLRKRKRWQANEVALEKFHSLEGTDDPYRDLQAGELKEIVKNALEKLPEKLRLIVVYYDMEGMSYKEISGIIKRPAGTVKSRLFRGRELLRKELGNIFETLSV